MSELPWNWAYCPYLDPPEKQKESALEAGYIKVVNKDDADKVIAELRHQKYKRCLDKASYWLAVSFQCVDDKHRQNAERHRRKWLELARQFRRCNAED